MICKNCGAEMQTESISCGRTPGRVLWCEECGRRVQVGALSGVLYSGRKVDPEDDE